MNVACKDRSHTTAIFCHSEMSCEPSLLALTVIHIVICTILTCTICYVFIIFLQNVPKMKPIKLTRNCGIIFLIITLLLIIIHGPAAMTEHECYGISNIRASLLNPWLLLYAIQNYVLLLLYFDRLRIVFSPTPLCLSNKTENIYKFIFALIPIYVISIVTLSFFFLENGIHLSIFIPLAVVFILGYIAFMLSLVILYIHKLIEVYKSVNAHNVEDAEFLVSAITKTTVLTIISLSMSFINMISTAIYFPMDDNLIISWISAYIADIDIYTNFLCLMLCFNHFDGYYLRSCSSIDKQCRMYWTKVTKSAYAKSEKMEEYQKKSGISKNQEKINEDTVSKNYAVNVNVKNGDTVQSDIMSDDDEIVSPSSERE